MKCSSKRLFCTANFDWKKIMENTPNFVVKIFKLVLPFDIIFNQLSWWNVSIELHHRFFFFWPLCLTVNQPILISVNKPDVIHQIPRPKCNDIINTFGNCCEESSDKLGIRPPIEKASHDQHILVQCHVSIASENIRKL